MLKIQKRDNSLEKMELLRQKEQENFEKAEEINWKLSSFRTPNIKKQNIAMENHE